VRRTHILLAAVLVAAIPAATAGSMFSFAAKPEVSGPCFISGDAAYRITAGAASDYTVRVDNAAAHPALRLQLVDDPARADFVLMDDSEAANACAGAASVKNIRVDAKAPAPDLTVTLSRAPADTKIFVRSAHFSQQDAAALFAVMWRAAHKSGPLRRIAGR
jgi:hypothetical protein